MLSPDLSITEKLALVVCAASASAEENVHRCVAELLRDETRRCEATPPTPPSCRDGV